jgi:hypothetical protein
LFTLSDLKSAWLCVRDGFRNWLVEHVA